MGNGMVNDQAFWNKIAKGYAAKPVADQDSYEFKLAKTQEYFDPSFKVLELGCGTGSTALIHAPHVKHILATDISEKMLEFGRQKAADAGIGNVTFECSSLDDFAAPAESFDSVLALNILHLVEDPETAIAKIFKLLRPGGSFISSTGCLGDMPFFVPLAISVMRFFGKAPDTVKVFKQAELLTMITSAGFSVDFVWNPPKEKVPFIVATKPS